MLHYEVSKTFFRRDMILHALVSRVNLKSCLYFQFPPYATNEIGKMGGINRRELGHGLCENAHLLLVCLC